MLFIEKRAVLEGKALKDAAHQQGKLLSFPWVSRVMAAVNKRISLHRMPVQIAKQQHIRKLLNAQYQLLEVKDLRVVNFGWIFPFLIEIVS